MRYLLGVDLGTSGTKTVLFDETGKVIASKTVEYPLLQPKNGWAEQDPKFWYDATIESVKAVLLQSKVNGNRIVVHFLYNSGSFSRTHKIFGAVKPVNAGFALISIKRCFPTNEVISSHCFWVLASHHKIALRRTLPSLSSITKPCI